MKKNEFWTIPNMITSYRLIVFPLILWFAISGRERLFVIFIILNLVTDFLDGYIARKFKMETEIGAKLDAFADNLTFVLGITGYFIFKMEELRPHLASFIAYIGSCVLIIIVSLIKFKRFPSFHLYIFKYSGYVQLAFFITIFTVGFIAPLYYLMVIWVITGCVEHIIIQMMLPEMRSNVRGLYWLLKERREEKKRQS